MSLLKTISTIGGLTLLSRILGFTRDILMAAFLGAGLVADCFFVAFKLPNFFRRLFAEGAFSSAFVPLFVENLRGDQGSEANARSFAEEALAVLLPVLLLVVALFEIAMPWLMPFLAPGFVDDAQKFDLAVDFTRNTFPYLLLISLVSLLSGVLNGLKKFAAAAAAPIFLNLTLIGSLILFHDSEAIAGRSLSVAVSIAGIVQFLWLMVAVKRAHMGLGLRLPRLTPRVRELGRIMLPVALGAGAIQISLVVDVILASLLPDGSLSYLFYADRLNQLPLGVVGVAVGTVLLSTLSTSLAEGKPEQAVHEQNRALEVAMFLTIPAAFALMAVPDVLIGVMFERGAFDSVATGQTALALIAYAAGLPAYVLIKVFTPAFFARKDTKTPVRIALTALAINMVLNIILMQFFAHVGLAMATAIGAWTNCGLLYITLRRREHFKLDARARRKTVGFVVAALLMAVVISYLSNLLIPYWQGATVDKVLALGAVVLAGLISYMLFCHITGAMKFSEIRRLRRSKS